jgi:hypothetical protein
MMNSCPKVTSNLNSDSFFKCLSSNDYNYVSCQFGLIQRVGSITSEMNSISFTNPGAEVSFELVSSIVLYAPC